jgi:hypothetical protein
LELIIDPSGVSRLIYDEAIDLGAVGNLTIQRASHVEPTARGDWQADLSPVGGPALGPFSKRSEALAAEVDWLHRHWLTRSAGG